MLQKYFLELHESNKTPYRLIDDTQIEPAGPEDPDELYRMQMRRPDGPSVVFDVVFFPDRAEIQGKELGVWIGEIKMTLPSGFNLSNLRSSGLREDNVKKALSPERRRRSRV